MLGCVIRATCDQPTTGIIGLLLRCSDTCCLCLSAHTITKLRCYCGDGYQAEWGENEEESFLHSSHNFSRHADAVGFIYPPKFNVCCQHHSGTPSDSFAQTPIYVAILRARCSGASSHAVHGVLYDGSPRVALLLAAGQHLHHLWFLYSSCDQKETCGRDGTLTHTTDLCCVSLFIKCVTRSVCKAEKKKKAPDLAPRWPLLGLSGSAER